MARHFRWPWPAWVRGAGLVGLLLAWQIQVVVPQERQPFPGMIEIPGGTFTMGRDDGPANEQPAHQAFLPTFYIDRNLVTVEEFTVFVQATGPAGPRGEMYLDIADPDTHIRHQNGVWNPVAAFALHPIGEVSWYGAVAYCQWRQKRLPSEAEWEKAARGTDGRLYPWGHDAPRPDLAFFGGWRGQTMPVGQFPRGASPYGVLDMAGQVWEWTTSVFKPYPYDIHDGREDVAAVAARVIRGGSTGASADKLTSTFREVVFPSRQATGHAYIGFRCVKPLEMMS